MSDVAEQPDWSRLPHDPEGFFRLAPTRNRRDLKREYARLIRQFKPELFPSEFQRIRAAYEELEQRLRYGSQLDSSIIQSVCWGAVSTVGRSDEGVSRTSTAPPLHGRLQRESPDLLYAELAGRMNKGPKDYFALALLSDIVDSDNLQFAKWLLAGISKCRDDGLIRLLYQYLRGPIPSQGIAELLTACSSHLPEDAFFPVTEPLWRHLVKSADFKLFQTTLCMCEKNLVGIHIHSRVVFYIQILRSVMWIATPAWNEESMRFVEENFQYIPRELDQDVDLLVAIQSYIRVRADFCRSDPLREMLDVALQAFFANDQVRADQEIIGAQLRLVDRGEELLASFADNDDPSLATFFPLWIWASHEVAERNIDSIRQFEVDSLWQNRIWKLIEKTSYSLGSSRVGFLWIVADVGIKCLYLCGFAVPTVLLIWFCIWYFDKFEPMSGEEGLAFLAYIASIVCAAGIGIGLRWPIKKYLATPLDTRMSKICYSKLWRRDILDLLDQSHIPVKLLAAQIGSVSSSRNSTWAWLYHHVERDVALALFSLAQRFLT